VFGYVRTQPKPNANVLARYEDGSPALLEANAGKGRVLLFTSSLGASWNDLPLTPLYLPLVHQMIRYVSSREEGSWHALGQTFLVAKDSGAGPPAVDSPDGARLTDSRQTPVPTALNKNAPKLSNPVRVRQLTLNETEGPNGPIGMFLNGHEMMDPATETPTLGTTEQWDIVNTTVDAHPIHLHLVQFQVIDRRPYDADGYKTALAQARAANPDAANPDPSPYFTGAPVAPDANERGWKDTVRANPGQVTRIRARWTLPAGVSAPQRYVFHCHILEHEDNSMMRPLELVA